MDEPSHAETTPLGTARRSDRVGPDTAPGDGDGDGHGDGHGDGLRVEVAGVAVPRPTPTRAPLNERDELQPLGRAQLPTLRVRRALDG